MCKGLLGDRYISCQILQISRTCRISMLRPIRAWKLSFSLASSIPLSLDLHFQGFKLSLRQLVILTIEEAIEVIYFLRVLLSPAQCSPI